VIIRYDTIEEFNVDSKAGCDQLNLAHETKTNKRQCPLSSVQVQYLWRQSGRNKSDYGGKDLWKRRVLTLDWKTAMELIPQVRWCICERGLVTCNEEGTGGRARVTADDNSITSNRVWIISDIYIHSVRMTLLSDKSCKNYPFTNIFNFTPLHIVKRVLQRSNDDSCDHGLVIN